LTNKKPEFEVSDFVSMLISGWYTGMCYYSNTPGGTAAQVDFVAYVTVLLLLLGVAYSTFPDEVILRAGKRHHVVRSFQITVAIIQILLFVVTSHFWLFLMRGLTIVLVRSRYRVAIERTEKAAHASRAP
jgi:hypothetical protein